MLFQCTEYQIIYFKAQKHYLPIPNIYNCPRGLKLITILFTSAKQLSNESIIRKLLITASEWDENIYFSVKLICINYVTLCINYVTLVRFIHLFQRFSIFCIFSEKYDCTNPLKLVFVLAIAISLEPLFFRRATFSYLEIANLVASKAIRILSILPWRRRQYIRLHYSNGFF